MWHCSLQCRVNPRIIADSGARYRHCAHACEYTHRRDETLSALCPNSVIGTHRNRSMPRMIPATASTRMLSWRLCLNAVLDAMLNEEIHRPSLLAVGDHRSVHGKRRHLMTSDNVDTALTANGCIEYPGSGW